MAPLPGLFLVFLPLLAESILCGKTPIQLDHEWACGTDKLNEFLAEETIERECPAKKNAINNCCFAHDACYGGEQSGGQKACDDTFCACLKNASAGSVCRFSVAPEFCLLPRPRNCNCNGHTEPKSLGRCNASACGSRFQSAVQLGCACDTGETRRCGFLGMGRSYCCPANCNGTALDGGTKH